LIKRIGIPGLDEALDPAEFLVVSDGGAPPNLHLRSSGVPGIDEAFLLYRVDEIAREQVSALRTRSIVEELIAKERQGLFVSLRTDGAKIGADAYQEVLHTCKPGVSGSGLIG
jgi:hypothetical protein